MRVAQLFAVFAVARAWQWDMPATVGAPSARVGHTLSLYSLGAGLQSRLLVCDGVGEGGAYLPGCIALDPFDGWRFTEALGSNDTAPRVDHTAVVFNGFLVLYGGLNASSGSPFDPAGCEVILAGSWRPAPGGECNGAVPAARWGHSAVLYGSQWFVYGGATFDGSPVDLADVAVLDMMSAPALTWTQPASVLNPPPSRHSHAAIAYGNLMIVYGGYSIAAGDSLKDLWVMPMDGPSAFIWSEIAPSGGIPTPLYGHRAVLVDSLIVMYGGQLSVGDGVQAIALSDGGAVWSTPTVDGDWTHAPFRAGVASLDADGDADPELVVFGGLRTDVGKPANGLAVLSEIGQNVLAPAKELPFILAGAACGAFLLLGMGYFAYRRARFRTERRLQAARKARMDEDGDGDGSGPGGSEAGASDPLLLGAGGYGSSYQAAAELDVSRGVELGAGGRGGADEEAGGEDEGDDAQLRF
jgi:hypothetical protein